MARQTKLAQVEALGWKLTPIPRRVAPGAMWNDPKTGRMSASFDDYERPAGWIVTPPAERGLPPRRFNIASPIPAVRWAYDQAMTPLPTVGSGVAGLALLMASAGKSGVVAEGVGDPPTPVRPDAELLHLCREIAGADRVADAQRASAVPCWEQPGTFKAMGDRLNEARRVRERLMPRVVELEATTPAGVLAKALAVVEMFNTSGARARAVRVLVKDLERVLGSQPGAAGVMK